MSEYFAKYSLICEKMVSRVGDEFARQGEVRVTDDAGFTVLGTRWMVELDTKEEDRLGAGVTSFG